MNDKKFQRIVKIGLLAVLVILLCFAVIFYFQYKAALKDPRNNVAYQNSDEELGINPAVAEQLEDYRCMAFYGADEDGVSGVMLVAALNWDTHHCKIFKVNPDTLMELSPNKKFNIKGQDLSKFACSYAYSRGGLVTSMRMLNRHMDLSIREGIAINLDAIRDLIDDLGGIEIKMSQSMCDQINYYYGHYGQITVENGKAHLNGQQAMEYLSTRNNNSKLTSDVDAASAFDIFLAVLHRAQEKKSGNLLKILKTTYTGCDTNMNIKDLAVFAKEINTYEIEVISNWPYKTKDRLVVGYEVAVPATLVSNVTKLHKELFGQENYEPTRTCRRLSKQKKINGRYVY